METRLFEKVHRVLSTFQAQSRWGVLDQSYCKIALLFCYKMWRFYANDWFQWSPRKCSVFLRLLLIASDRNPTQMNLEGTHQLIRKHLKVPSEGLNNWFIGMTRMLLALKNKRKQSFKMARTSLLGPLCLEIGFFHFDFKCIPQCRKRGPWPVLGFTPRPCSNNPLHFAIHLFYVW